MTDKVAAAAKAQRDGVVSAEMPAELLLDQVLSLAHGSLTLAGHANSWTDEQRTHLGASVARLVRPAGQ